MGYFESDLHKNSTTSTTKPLYLRDGFPAYRYDSVRRWQGQWCNPSATKSVHKPYPSRYCSVRPNLKSIREDMSGEQLLISCSYRTVHTGMAKNKRQPYAVSEKAGHQTSAESW